MQLLTGKVAVVTGGGRGIGRAHALALAAAGAAVVVNDVGLDLRGGEGGRGLEPGAPRPEVAKAVVAEITAGGGRAVADASDVSTLAGAGAVVATALRHFGDVHIVVNNAGTWNETTVEDVDDERIDEQFAVHFKGTVGTTRAAFAAMRSAGHGGQIINTVSGVAASGAGGMAVYCAAKAAVASYTFTSAAEGAPYGIRVNAISPLAITRHSRRYFSEAGLVDLGDDATIEHLNPAINSPLVVYLASDLSEQVTGRAFAIVPQALKAGAPIGIMELYAGSTEGVVADHWTVQSIAAALPDVIQSASTGPTDRT